MSDKVDVASAATLSVNGQVLVRQGITPGHAAFVLSDAVRATMVSANVNNNEIIHPYMIGDDILTTGKPSRWLLDFEDRNILQARAYSKPFAHVQSSVLPDRQSKAEEGKDAAGNLRPHHKAFLAKWWQLSYSRPELAKAIQLVPRYLACSRVTKRPLFAFVSSTVRPGDALQAFVLADDYS